MDEKQINSNGNWEHNLWLFLKIFIGFVVTSAIFVGFVTLFFEFNTNKKIEPRNSEGWSLVFNSDKSSKQTSLITQEKYVASSHEWNFVRWWAMSLAWNELIENIVKEPLRLEISGNWLKIAEILNAKYFTKKDLDDASYYVKSGFGPSVIEEINRDSKAKFPEKSFDDLSSNGIKPSDIISYAYFYKKLAYKKAFEKSEMIFNDSEKVKSFVPDENYDIIENIRYWNDEKFIVAIKLKEDEDEIFLAKWFDIDNWTQVVDVLKNELATSKRKPLNSDNNFDDFFEAPMINIDLEKNYLELIDAPILNTINGKTDYKIWKMFEKIKFEMDEVGVKVENEAGIMMTDEIMMEEKKIERKFFLNQPYWIIMKKKNSENPYFIVGVKNTKIMKKVD